MTRKELEKKSDEELKELSDFSCDGIYCVNCIYWNGDGIESCDSNIALCDSNIAYVILIEGREFKWEQS